MCKRQTNVKKMKIRNKYTRNMEERNENHIINKSILSRRDIKNYYINYV